jgi:hypothetical protein
MQPEADGKKWGRVTIPFTTHGGIASGIAFEEAGKLQRKPGKTVAAGLKVNAPRFIGGEGGDAGTRPA